MNIKKLLLLLTLALTVVSCKKDDDGGDDTFLLNRENLAATYIMNSYIENVDETYVINGVPIDSNTNTVGDTFQGTTTFDADGNFTIDVQYRITETITVAGEAPLINTAIIIENYSGTYTLNATAETITLNYVRDGFNESDTYDVTAFSRTAFGIGYTDINSNSTTGESYELTGEILFDRQ
ncbi:hypothetical protein POV27_00625 [Aureisphaera galaxeae]|uniref:hypothetical protein n=1 Tax=Aureisphaera galaxeae TaxID=1538023 RepID=UPI0023505EB4|nr:hypothetical protein [Aureisphaera galaxeae]MDC8002540.1 hypothetical protein [Aureisphaera galaxeae]